MTKNQKTGLIIVSIVLVILVVLFIVLRKKKSAAGGSSGSSVLPANPQGGGGTGNQNTPDSYPVGLGSNGNVVKTLQSKFNQVIAAMDAKGVNNYGLKKLSVDGNWGPKTDNAFRQITALAGSQLTSVSSASQLAAILQQADNYIAYLNTQADNNNSWYYNLFPY